MTVQGKDLGSGQREAQDKQEGVRRIKEWKKFLTLFEWELWWLRWCYRVTSVLLDTGFICFYCIFSKIQLIIMIHEVFKSH